MVHYLIFISLVLFENAEDVSFTLEDMSRQLISNVFSTSSLWDHVLYLTSVIICKWRNVMLFSYQYYLFLLWLFKYMMINNVKIIDIKNITHVIFLALLLTFLLASPGTLSDACMQCCFILLSKGTSPESLIMMGDNKQVNSQVALIFFVTFVFLMAELMKKKKKKLPNVSCHPKGGIL